MGWRMFGSDGDEEAEIGGDGDVDIDWIVIDSVSESLFGDESGKVQRVRGLKLGRTGEFGEE